MSSLVTVDMCTHVRGLVQVLAHFTPGPWLNVHLLAWRKEYTQEDIHGDLLYIEYCIYNFSSGYKIHAQTNILYKDTCTHVQYVPVKFLKTESTIVFLLNLSNGIPQ